MGYKLKPNKAVKKRFKVTAKGKLKRHHTLTSHLRSGRSSKKKRHLRRPAIVAEGFARNMRRLMGVRKSPGRAIKLAQRKAAAAKAAVEKTSTEKATA